MDFWDVCQFIDEAYTPAFPGSTRWADQAEKLSGFLDVLPGFEPHPPRAEWHAAPLHHLVVLCWDYEQNVALFAVPEAFLSDTLRTDLSLLDGCRLTVHTCASDSPELMNAALRVQQACAMLSSDTKELLERLASMYRGDDLIEADPLDDLFAAWKTYHVGTCEPDHGTWTDAGRNSPWAPRFERLSVRISAMSYIRIEDAWM